MDNFDVGSVLDTGLEFAGNLLKGDQKPAPAPKPVVKTTNYTPFIIGGVVLLVLGIVGAIALKK